MACEGRIAVAVARCGLGPIRLTWPHLTRGVAQVEALDSKIQSCDASKHMSLL
jgi:hypothetical protein